MLLITIAATRSRLGPQLNTRSPSLHSPSVLHRRQREPELQSWSKNQKLRFAEFAEQVCVEYDVPTAEKDDIVTKSQVSASEFNFQAASKLPALHT